MNAPDKCPGCGLEIQLDEFGKHYVSKRGQMYRCGTWFSLSSGDLDEDFHCFKRQRDALAARVKELEPYEAICKNPAALWANWLRGTVVLPAGIGDVRQEQARVKELEAYAERLERAGDTLATVTLRNGNSHGQWHAAKETKP